MKLPASVKRAHSLALRARRNAHAPYSGFRVGAALQIAGKTVVGCNVENASYGATMCAERTALFAAVATHGEVKPSFLVIVTGEKKATVPCGLCLQALAEFCADEMPVYLGNEKGVLECREFREFLPRAFRSFKKDKR